MFFLKQTHMKLNSFFKIKKFLAFHRKHCFSAKILVKILQKIFLACFFSFFQKLKKISEFNKKKSLPRIQVIPISDISDEEKEPPTPYNEFCKDIDKSIVYNQVIILKLIKSNIFFFFSCIIKKGLCRKNIRKKNNFFGKPHRKKKKPFENIFLPQKSKRKS